MMSGGLDGRPLTSPAGHATPPQPGLASTTSCMAIEFWPAPACSSTFESGGRGKASWMISFRTERGCAGSRVDPESAPTSGAALSRRWRSGSSASNTSSSASEWMGPVGGSAGGRTTVSAMVNLKLSDSDEEIGQAGSDQI